MSILKFYSTNCDSCLKMLPLVDAVENLYLQNQTTIKIESINTSEEKNTNLLAKFGIIQKQTLLPCLIFLDSQGNEISRLLGKIALQELIQNIDKMLLASGVNSPSINFNLPDLEKKLKLNERQDIADFVEKANQIKKDNPLDLSSDEDLSIAIMNLISIEEHLFFTANKTQNNSYYEIMKEVREVRKRALKMIITEYEGEVWCISKHLLASSMRLMEVGTKQLGQGKNEKAFDLFEDAYKMYLLFWGLNMNIINSKTTTNSKNATKFNSDYKFGELGETFKENVDCCCE